MDRFVEGPHRAFQTIRCGCCLRNPWIRNQTLAAPDFLRDSRPGPRFLKILMANQHDKCRKKKESKCHEIGPGGSDFDENLCGRRYFFIAHLPRGSRPDVANSKFEEKTKKQEIFMRHSGAAEIS